MAINNNWRKTLPSQLDLENTIKNDLYSVRIKQIDLYSLEEIREFGTATAIDAKLDRNILNSYITVMITIAAIINYYKDGIIVKIVNQTDVQKIYDIVQNYISVWARRVEDGINYGDAPIEDLIIMEQFNASLFKFAVDSYKPDESDDAFSSFFTKAGFVSRDTFFNNTRKTNSFTIINPDNSAMLNSNNEPTRQEFSDLFKSKLYEFKKLG